MYWIGKMRRILVTALSGDIGNSLVKILSKKTDAIIFGCDVNELVPSMDILESFWQCRYAIEENYIDELVQNCVEKNITHLIPVNEREIEVVSEYINRFDDIGVRVIIQNVDILRICLDKKATCEYLEKQHVAVPRLMNAGEFENRQMYIVKQRKSNGSKGIHIYSGREISNVELDANDVVQEYIDSDDEYTVGVFRDRELTNVIVFKRELKNGYSNIVKLSHNKMIEDIAVSVAKMLDLSGYINIQGKLKNGVFYIFEINPRLSGTSRFQDMIGFESLLWWLDLVDGKTIPKYVNRFKEAIGLRELNEKFIFKR